MSDAWVDRAQASVYCGVPVGKQAFGFAAGILRKKGLLPLTP
ncbi:MAG: hypothetical protein Q8K31_07290 [Burkholderiaceae bacterium]|nr:hypothetical protein [Burkholderiaceae bacterium]MDO9088804.1 hypothetical protein [Burkholderiaceae bacterium]MDP1968972.1 hypothetical protein [Burkholderiaceae bacterium]